MKSIFTIMLLLLPLTNVTAAEFRGLTFGSSCNEIEGNEATKGGVLKEKQNATEGQYLYSGIYYGFEAKIVYQCVNQTLQQGMYIISNKPANTARSVFLAIRSELHNLYGKPNMDTSDPDYIASLRAMGLNDLSDEKEIIISWEKQDYNVGMTFSDSVIGTILGPST